MCCTIKCDKTGATFAALTSGSPVWRARPVAWSGPDELAGRRSWTPGQARRRAPQVSSDGARRRPRPSGWLSGWRPPATSAPAPASGNGDHSNRSHQRRATSAEHLLAQALGQLRLVLRFSETPDRTRPSQQAGPECSSPGTAGSGRKPGSVGSPGRLDGTDVACRGHIEAGCFGWPPTTSGSGWGLELRRGRHLRFRRWRPQIWPAGQGDWQEARSEGRGALGPRPSPGDFLGAQAARRRARARAAPLSEQGGRVSGRASRNSLRGPDSVRRRGWPRALVHC